MPRDTSNIAPGRPGFGQIHFPEGARKNGRRLALSEDVTIYRYSAADDGGGSPTETYTADKGTVKGRVDPVGGGGPREAAGTINENTTHIVTLEPGTGITPKDRVGIAGATWRVLMVQTVSDPWVTRMEVEAL